MKNDVFYDIDCRLVEIMDIIEHQKGFPLLSKDLDSYIEESPQNAKLLEIYFTVSNLRIF